MLRRKVSINGRYRYIINISQILSLILIVLISNIVLPIVKGKMNIKSGSKITQCPKPTKIKWIGFGESVDLKAYRVVSLCKL